MAKKEKAVYAPGEFDRIRKQLGVTDADEAKRMANVLGGEVGMEKTPEEVSREKDRSRTRHEVVDVKIGGKGQPKRRVETISDDEESAAGQGSPQKKITDPRDDPDVPLRLTYRERVKMDRLAGQIEYEIKTVGQVLYSMIVIWGDIPDAVNPAFITKRMNDYYRRIESLVTITRTMFPRNNISRSEKLRKASGFAYAILDVIRYWNLDRMTSELARVQSKPRSIKVSDLAEFIKAVYRPLYILEKLNPDAQIKDAYRLLFKQIYLETPTIEVKKKYEEMVKDALNAYIVIERDVRHLLYPLLLKLCSDKFLPYGQFFLARKNRIASFLNVSEKDRITLAAFTTTHEEENKAGENTEDKQAEKTAEETVEETKKAPTKEEEEQRAAIEAESKAVKRGQNTLELVFPRAGWERLSTFPDMYPYFHDVFTLRRGYELIAPTDPLLQIAVLMRILDEFFIGLRYVTFTAMPGTDVNNENTDEVLNKIVTEWRDYIRVSFEQEYLPRLSEYCRILDTASETRTSTYARKLLNELHWIKRNYFLPYYRFESIFPPTLKKQDITPLYPVVRKLRKHLTLVAGGIEQGTKRGGAEKNTHCDGIENPWAQYNFEVPNPVSRRMDAVLGGRSSSRQKTNASLIFFTLSAVVVLDYLMNDEHSWAYGENSDWIFRSINGDGIMPLMGVDIKINTDMIFSQAQKERGNKGRQPLSPPQ